MNEEKAKRLKKTAENSIKIINLLMENRLSIMEIAQILDVNHSLVSYYKKQLNEQSH